MPVSCSGRGGLRLAMLGRSGFWVAALADLSGLGFDSGVVAVFSALASDLFSCFTEAFFRSFGTLSSNFFLARCEG